MIVIKSNIPKGQWCRNDDKLDESRDWLQSALCFSGALGFLLKENEGIFIKAENTLLELDTNTSGYIVYSCNKQVHIQQCNESLTDGQLLWMDER